MFFFYRALFIINVREHSGIFWAASTDCLSDFLTATSAMEGYHVAKVNDVIATSSLN